MTGLLCNLAALCWSGYGFMANSSPAVEMREQFIPCSQDYGTVSPLQLKLCQSFFPISLDYGSVYPPQLRIWNSFSCSQKHGPVSPGVDVMEQFAPAGNSLSYD